MMLKTTTRSVGVVLGTVFAGLCTQGAGAAEMPAGTSAVESVTAISPAEQRMYDGMRHAQENRYAEAVPLLEEAMALNPTLIGVWETLGWSYWHLGRKVEAEQLWERFRLLAPDEPAVYVWLAQLAAERRELDRAADLLDRAVELSPDDFEARLNLARIHLWRGRLGDSVRALSALVEQDPDRLDAVLELARARQYSLEYAEALALWERMLAVAPQVVEYRLGAAVAMLHTGRRAEGVSIARSVLEQDPRNVEALKILADDAEYGDNRMDASPYLHRAIEASEDSDEIEFLRRRLVALLVDAHLESPQVYLLDPAIRVARDRVKDRPLNVDARLLLAELLLMNRQYRDAETEFMRVLREFNARNTRALRGMFEVCLARFQFKDANEYMEAMAAFNPRDPYLLVDRARYYARMGRYIPAHEAVDELERRGGQGAVAMLQYHTLSPSDIGPALPVANFREHLTALRNAGYRFLTANEVGGYLEQVRGMPDRYAGVAPTRAVAVTFDNGLEHAMRLATPVAQETGLVFTQFLTVDEIESRDPLVSDWAQLRAFQETGRWQYGSHLLRASQAARVFMDDAFDAPLANRIHREDLGRVETRDEFDARLRVEYGESKALIATHLGQPPTSVAYPLGDIGQAGASNEPEAISLNQTHAASAYDVGFLVRSEGHAVAGDNPLMYGRFEPSNFMSGDEVMVHLMSRHPVFWAQRMRLEFATFSGRRGLARDTLELMKNSGYPESEVDRLERFIKARLARKFDMPLDVDDVDRPPWRLQLDKPHLGAGVRYFWDSLDSRNWNLFGFGGLHLTPNLTVEGRIGAGEYRQPDLRLGTGAAAADESVLPDLKVREHSEGATVSVLLPRRTVLSGELALRSFSGDADWDMWRHALSLNIRPLEPIEFKAFYEHDAVEGARALRRELTHDLIGLHGVWSPTDRWDIWASGRRYDFSDDNVRTHWHVLPTFLLWRDPGLIVGVRYAEDDSRRADRDYWTPFRQQGIHLEVGFRGSYRRHYYSVIGSIGRARERIRPEDRRDYNQLVALYEDLLERARRGRWGSRAIQQIQDELNGLLAAPLEDEWETVLGLSASATFRIGQHWEIEGLGSYQESRRYDATHLGALVRYRF